MILIPLILGAVGVVFLVFPDWVRRYEQGMTRFIKERDEYVLTLRIMGLGFVLMSALISAMFLLGIMH